VFSVAQTTKLAITMTVKQNKNLNNVNTVSTDKNGNKATK